MQAGASWATFIACGVIAIAQGSSDSITISGTVTDSITGQAIGGASVSLQAGAPKAEMAAYQAQMEQSIATTPPRFPQPSNLRAVTESDGKFSFQLAEPSFAYLHVSRSGYAESNQQSLTDFGSSVQVRLVPLGAIEGRVVDENGELLQGIVVEMIQAVIEDGRKMFRPFLAVRSDDRGQFRFWNLAPNSYYLKGAGRQATSAKVGPSSVPVEADHAYATVFYPGVPDRQSASLIRILPGQTARADFSLEAQESYRIRGVIQNRPSGARLGVRLMRGQDSVGNRVAIDTASGAFVVYDVLPGDYTLQAFAPGNPAMSLGEANVSVGEQDVSGVTVSLSTGVSVRGKIEHIGAPDKDDDDADGDGAGFFGSPIRPPRGHFVSPIQTVILEPGRLPVAGTQPPASVDAGGNFTFADMLPGKYAFRISSGSGYVASIRSGTTDVIAEDLDVGFTDPEPLVVTLSTGGGRVKGTVSGLAPGEIATVAIVPAGGASRLTVTAVAAQLPNGHDARFQTNNLAPGDYAVYAWPQRQQVEYRNPEALRAFSGSAVTVTVSEGGEEEVTLKLVSVEN